MTARLGALIYFFVLVGLASAQAYTIRVTNNTNLRASYSLDSAILSSAPAGTTLQVAGSHGRWLQISRDNRSYWMAGWVSHSRVADQHTTATQTQSTANVDNCCFVNRQCATNQDWVDGYHAFQRNECPVNQPAQVATSTRPVNVAPANVDNCCYVNMQCATDEDWRRGWAAYKHYQCRTDVPVSIEGGPIFREQILESFLTLRRTAPYWYDYTVRGLNKVVQTFSYADTYVDTKNKVFYLDYGEHWPTAFTRHEHLVFTASILVHEACHVHRDQAGLEAGGLVGEKACTERQLEAHIAMDPNDPRANEHRETLANIHDPSTWWW